MPNLFCFLLFSILIFKLRSFPFSADEEIKPTHFYNLSQKVASILHCLSKRATRMSSDLNYVRKSNECHKDLFVLGSKYVHEALKYILLGGHHVNLFHNLNSHLLLQLCSNSIPVFHHAFGVSNIHFPEFNLSSMLKAVLFSTFMAYRPGITSSYLCYTSCRRKINTYF